MIFYMIIIYNLEDGNPQYFYCIKWIPKLKSNEISIYEQQNLAESGTTNVDVNKAILANIS